MITLTYFVQLDWISFIILEERYNNSIDIIKLSLYLIIFNQGRKGIQNCHLLTELASSTSCLSLPPVWLEQ